MGTNGKVKTVLAVILSVVLLLGVVSWQKAQAQHKYTAEEVSNLVFNDALYLLRTVFVSSVFTQINNRRYQMDEIFNMVYDDVNHSLRVTVLADSAHEFRALWSDTVLARLYATKDGACIYFWMRGVHGDTIAKFEDRHHNIMATLDTTGEWKAYGYKFFVWTNANNPADSMKLWARHDTLFWNDAVGVPHAVYPVPAAPSAIMAFGDTNAYYASIASYGANRDSIGGYYFSGAGAIQAAINRASIAATSANRKTVYILEGTYLQPCTTKSYIRIVGMGKSNTILQFNDANRYYGGGHEFSVDNLTMELQQSGAGPFGFSVQGSDRVEYRNVDVISVVGNYVTLSSTAGDTILFDNCELYSRNPSNYCQIVDTIGGADPYQQFIKCKIVGNTEAINIISTAGDQGVTPGKIDFRECFLTSVGGYGVRIDPSYVSAYLLLNFYHSHVEKASGGLYSLAMGQSTGYNEAHAYSTDFIGQVYGWSFANNLFWADGGCHIDTKGADYPIVTSVAGATWPDTMGVVHWREGVKRQPYGMHNTAHDTIGGKPATPHEGWDSWTTRSGANGDTLWVWSNNAWNNVWPAAGGGALAFGDTNAYFVSKFFGPGYDSIGGRYFNRIQAALNAAALANDSVHFKTVYILPGYYNEPCSLGSFINMRGLGGKPNTQLLFNATNKFVSNGARRYAINDLTIVDSLGNQVCSLASRGVKKAHYCNVDFTTSKSGTLIGVRFALASSDTLILENCDIGRSHDGAAAFRGNIAGLDSNGFFYMKNCHVQGSGGGLALDITTYAAANIAIYHSTFEEVYGSGAAFRNNGNMTSVYYFSNCSFTGQYTAIVFTLNAPASTIFQNVSCIGGITTVANQSVRSYGLAMSDESASVGPMLTVGSFSGPVVWRNVNGKGWFFGGVSFDTTITKPGSPHNGMTFMKANASPNDSILSFMDADWRNLDRTWATGRDSVLVNQASDTLAITGIQTTSFVEVQLESDPGVNIGSPYHTLTANQDILIWPTPCVTKFYYRWRIH